jgi:hypothetical protein
LALRPKKSESGWEKVESRANQDRRMGGSSANHCSNGCNVLSPICSVYFLLTTLLAV